MSATEGPNIIADSSLVLSLDCANRQSYPGSGTTWYDLAGTNNGTLVNTPTFSNANNGYFTFNGSNQYANCGSSMITGNNVFSWGLWIKPTSTGTPLLLGNTTSGAAMLSYWDSNNSKIRVGIWGSDKLTANTTIPVGTWSHTFWTWDGTTLKSYTNGIPDGSATSFSFNISNTYLTIGSAYTQQYFGGNIASTLIYNRALNSAEILQNYLATKSRFLP